MAIKLSFWDLCSVSAIWLPAEKSWVSMPSGDLPTAVWATNAIELPGNKLLVYGGVTQHTSTPTYIGILVQ